MNRKKTAPKVAIVADWITNPGGDDKVLRALCNLFPAAPLYTTIYKQEDMPHYKNRHIHTTWLNKILLPHQVLVPLMFNALRHFDFSSFDFDWQDRWDMVGPHCLRLQHLVGPSGVNFKEPLSSSYSFHYNIL